MPLFTKNSDFRARESQLSEIGIAMLFAIAESAQFGYDLTLFSIEFEPKLIIMLLLAAS